MWSDEPVKTDDPSDIYGGSTDDEMAEERENVKEVNVVPPSPKETSSSDRDTEDELRR